MPYVVTCPACTTRLKTPNPVPAGRAVTCPQCKHAFKTTAISPELADTGTAPAVPRPPVPAPRRGRQEELPDAEIVDDEEDDDDRPKSRRRDEDDEDDDLDRPAPRRRAKKPQKKKSRLVLVLAIGLPVLFLLLVGGGFLAYNLFFSGGATADMLAWAPTDTETLRGVKCPAFKGHPDLRRSVQGALSRVENLGVPADTMDEALVANGPGGEAVVVRLTAAPDPAVLMRISKAGEKSAHGKKYYNGPGGAFHLAAGKLLVYCPAELTMIELLRKGATVTVDDDLRAYAKKAGDDLWHASVTGRRGGINQLGFSRPRAEYGGRRIAGDRVRDTYTQVFADTTSAYWHESQMKFTGAFLAAKGTNTLEVSSGGLTVTVVATGTLYDGGPTVLGGL